MIVEVEESWAWYTIRTASYIFNSYGRYISKVSVKSLLIKLRLLLLLPNLKSLIIYTLEDRQPLVDGREVIKFEWPYRDKKSALEDICFYKAGTETPSISNFLSPYLFLRSFVWENIGLLDDEDPPSYEKSAKGRSSVK
jgi:hypothetical protein